MPKDEKLLAVAVYMESLAHLHANSDRKLLELANQYDEAIAKVDLCYESSLKAAVSRWQYTSKALETLVKNNPELFEKKKSRTFEGVRFGYQKAKGKVILPKNLEKLIVKMKAVIGKVKYKRYVKVTETPQKLLLADLKGKDLKALGIKVIDDVDAPYVKVKSAGAKKVEDMLKNVLLETEGPNDG